MDSEGICQLCGREFADSTLTVSCESGETLTLDGFCRRCALWAHKNLKQLIADAALREMQSLANTGYPIYEGISQEELDK